MPQLMVAHDVVCPWCWVARKQAARLQAEFPTLTFRWVGYELHPEGVGEACEETASEPPTKPRVPTRLELLLLVEGLTLPRRTRGPSRSRMALEGAEYAYEAGLAEPYLDALYHTYWEEDRDISSKRVLTEVAEEAGLDIGAFLDALETRRYRSRVVEFDTPAHARGVWHVPTWMFPEEWVAEQPYPVLHTLAARFVQSEAAKEKERSG